MATGACFFVCLAVLPHSAQPPPSVQLASASSLSLALLTVQSHHQPPFPLCSLPISPCPLPPPLSEAHQWQPISSATSSLGAPPQVNQSATPAHGRGGGAPAPTPAPPSDTSQEMSSVSPDVTSPQNRPWGRGSYCLQATVPSQIPSPNPDPDQVPTDLS